MTKYDCTLPKLRVYKGSRYVPKFAVPLQWSKDMDYEELTVVYNCGRTYISKMRVPANEVDLPEYPHLANKHWATYADYNAQLELYREEVRSFSLRYDQMFCWLKAEKERLEAKLNQEIQDRKDADAALNEHFHKDLGFNSPDHEGDEAFGGYATVKLYIDAKIAQAVENLTQTINNVKNELTNVINNLGDNVKKLGDSIVNKVYLGGEVDPDTGEVTWPTDDKIAIGNMNWYSGASNDSYIKTAPDGDGDMRAQ